MAPLDDVLCPDGTSDAAIRPDGTHYDGAGADRIAPAVMATARAAFARSTGVGQSSVRTPRSPNQASSATHRRELIGLVRSIGVGERVAADALGHAHERVREHHAVLG